MLSLLLLLLLPTTLKSCESLASFRKKSQNLFPQNCFSPLVGGPLNWWWPLYVPGSWIWLTILFCCSSELGPRGFKRYRSYIIYIIIIIIIIAIIIISVYVVSPSNTILWPVRDHNSEATLCDVYFSFTFPPVYPCCSYALAISCLWAIQMLRDAFFLEIGPPTHPLVTPIALNLTPS